MPKISVIVPVYKVEQYLDRCVRSILSQSIRSDVELILVDDGSPDRCGQLCDDYARQDSRVHVIHQSNAGLSAARNAALDWMMENSESQWLTFVDSDDWIHSEMLQRLLTAVEQLDTRIGICGYGETPDTAPWQVYQSREFHALWEPTPWNPEDLYRERFVNATIACAKLYHRSCFEDVRFPVGKVHEDEFVTYRLLFRQERLAVIDAPMYAYYINPQGITKGQWSKRRLDAWEAYDQQIAFFASRGQKELVQLRLRNYLENGLLNLEAAEKTAGPETVEFIKKRIRRVIRQCWRWDCIQFWIDYDVLYRFYPLTTRGYRLWISLPGKLRRKKDA